MRRPLSTKFKLTLWFTCFMSLLAAVCLGLILIISSRVAQSQAFNVLSMTVRGNISKISSVDGSLSLAGDFSFYSNDVYMLIYSREGALLSGQTPPSFPVNTELENGVSRFVPGEADGFYVLDFWVPSGWEEGFWLRGVLRSPDRDQAVDQIFLIFSVILPFFILTAAIGGYFIAKRALSPISYISGAAGSISEGRDLTQRISLPRGSDLEMQRLADAFNHMFARLEQAFEAEKQFTSDASHELRTPTSVILAQCSFVEKHGDDLEEYREAIDVIHRQARKMSQLTQSLLDMTRLDLGTRQLAREDLDLSAMTRDICEEQDTGGRSISLEASVEEGIHMEGDVFQLSRVIINLLENARKYGREGGHIRVRLSRQASREDGSLAVLTVEDDGIGIPAEHLDKIWQRFYQVNPSRQSGAGLGLGLSMVRQIVLLHGGTIEAESEEGKGSRFTVKFPAL